MENRDPAFSRADIVPHNSRGAPSGIGQGTPAQMPLEALGRGRGVRESFCPYINSKVHNLNYINLFVPEVTIKSVSSEFVEIKECRVF